ncbi:CHAT domain-containing protein [Plectonema cf. radiosum LEGE 06105]|uniref:CHAT domain-containing protein n=1 Tax=Plectonema cf. radiosum LEGE 06105 TaxID=945769 RepID=A0A8J7FDW4_9CYAN|nr:CHAT domain-containing protein [Plectonema radiosum]MBE9212456.1 CHAT domain-containing protein [Plectonema cf. radiosum LEGE 06105]
MKSKNKRIRLLQLLFCTTLLICISFGQVVSAQNPQINLFVEKGVRDYKNGNFSNAIKHWQEALVKYQNQNNPSATAVIHENLGRAYQKLGENQAAITSFLSAIRNYQAVKDIPQVGRMHTELAQVYSSLGQSRKAISLLCGKVNQGINNIECQQESAVQIANNYNDKQGKVAALGVLGEVYRLIGNYDRGIAYLQAAQNIDSNNFLVLNSLGNAYLNRAQLRELQAKSAAKIGLNEKQIEFNQKSKTDFQVARENFKNSIKLAREENKELAEMRGLLNLIKLGSLTDENQTQNQTQVLDDTTFNHAVKNALRLLENLPDSETKVYGAIDLAYLQKNSQTNSPFTKCPIQLVLPEQTLSLLQKSVSTSNKLQDNRLQSYSLGALGHFWECNQNNQKALQYTQNAIVAADNKLSAKESLYLWEWQAGRILDQQNQKQQAIESYQRAFETLEDIRLDILTAKRDVQFDFRDVVRPLYRTLAQSRLELLQAGAIPNEQRDDELSKVVTTIDALKLAELQNYFGNDCVLSGLNPKQVDELLEDKQNSAAYENTVFLSSIILDGKTGILLQSANQPTKFRWIKDSQQRIVSSKELERTIAEFRDGLVKGEEALNYDPTIAAQLYDWIIRPFADDIQPDKVKTLVFIQDGFLRSVPMAPLYDNQQKKYLVETYAIATTPSLRLTVTKPNRNKQKALILGLTETSTIDGKTFPQIYAVENEIKAVQKLFPNHTQLIDENFIPQNFQQKLQQTTYPIIHIASHAQFGIIPQDTFIVTGKNKKITINQLENSLQNLKNPSDSVEILALTACQTALGDDRATLGLAGVALQVGVKSAIASLWNVQDDSTARLVEEFYKNYSEREMTIAQALQKAQIKMINTKKLPPSERIDIKHDNPVYWGAMIVIGNWL